MIKHVTHQTRARQAAGAGMVTALVNIYGIVDNAVPPDIVEMGAFAEAARDPSRVKILDGHNIGSVLNTIAKPVKIRELNRAELPAAVRAKHPDATGALELTAEFMLDDPTSKAVYSRLAAGVLSEWSVGFEAVDFAFADVGGKTVRVLKRAKLWEVSVVHWGANPGTITTSVKASTAPALDPAIAARLAKITADLDQNPPTWQESVQSIIWYLKRLPDEPPAPRATEPDENALGEIQQWVLWGRDNNPFWVDQLLGAELSRCESDPVSPLTALGYLRRDLEKLMQRAKKALSASPPRPFLGSRVLWVERWITKVDHCLANLKSFNRGKTVLFIQPPKWR